MYSKEWECSLEFMEYDLEVSISLPLANDLQQIINFLDSVSSSVKWWFKKKKKIIPTLEGWCKN